MKVEYIVPVVVLLRDVMEVVYTAKEAKYVVQNEFIKVNGSSVKTIKSPIGMFDVIEIPKLDKKFMFLFNTNGRVRLVDINDNLLYAKVTNKTMVKGGKAQINTMNGYNMVVDTKEASKISTNSTVAIDITKKKITSILPLDVKSEVYIMDGKYRGQFGVVTQVTNNNGVAPDLVTIQIGDVEHITAKEYCYVIDSSRRVD
jgi:small subunit ribosomal protein S4e